MPPDDMSMENHGGMILTGKTPGLTTRAPWKFYQQSYLVEKQEEHGNVNAEFYL
jgi:hypothetical protein